MKTHCPSCGKSSLNLLHRETGALYCSSCGKQIQASETIKAALARKGAYLPSDFFSDVPVAAPIAAKPTSKVDARTAAMNRIRQSQSQLSDGPLDSDVSKKISIPKISREEAAARKAAIVASLENTQETIERVQQGPGPSLAQDFAEQGIDLWQANEALKQE